MEPLPSGAGQRRLNWQQIYTSFAIAGLVGTLIAVGVNAYRANVNAKQVGQTGQALMQSQRLAKAVSTAMVGNSSSFRELTESLDVLTSVTRGLNDGNDQLSEAPGNVKQLLAPVLPMVERAEKAVKVVIGQERC